MARVFELTTPLGPDVLLFRSMHGREELGRPSELTLTALSERRDINPANLLGQDVTVKMELQTGGWRYFNAYVTRFAPDGTLGRYFQYRFTARPWLWLLTRTADCRIFQDKTVPEILREMFHKYPFATFDDADLTDIYTRREYCVQYRETDFNFVSRLMEEEGIYYYFEHHDGQHVMKLVDSYSGHKALAHAATIAYRPPDMHMKTADEHIHAWTFTQNIQPGAVALDDYDFTKPKADLTAKAKVIEPHEHATYEIFDYPGEYEETGPGEHYARARIDELHTDFDRAEAACNVREIAVGRLFNLTNAPRLDQEREYLITSARYDCLDNSYESQAGEGATYYCSFTALQSRQQFRPARLTPEPRVAGPQTALVVGPAGEEIYTDKYGRVKVQFYWDRYGKKDANSSCWIRVAHPWAGGTWGAIFLPRIGHEVVVDFLEGDPDRPLIVGSVYNADQMPPYSLPANKTQSGVKTRSSLAGGPANFNEIRFEDKKGSEQLFIHAEKNQDIEVENDETHWVGHDRTKTIDRNETTHIKHDRTETVDNDETITIHHNRTEMVDLNETITVGANRTRTVEQNEIVTVLLTRTHTVGVNEAITIGAAQEVTIGATQVVTVGASATTTIGSDASTSIGKNLALQVGGNETRSIGKDLQTQVGDNENRSVGKKLHIDVGDEVVISCGQSVLTMKKDGTIKIEGKDITIDAMSKIDEKAINITSEASAKSMTKGAMVNVEASGINTIKGSLVKIN